MKKTIFTIVAVCAAATCLSACNMSCEGDKPATPVDPYDAINEMFNADYSKIDVTVTNTFDEGAELVSTYEMNYSGNEITINYSIERFTGISLDDASMEKAVTTGTAKVVNGIVTDDNDMIDVIPQMMYTFKAEYFSNVNEALLDMMLKADVTDPLGFMGANIKCTDMKVSAEYITAFNKMEITYKGESGNSVKITYDFTV